MKAALLAFALSYLLSGVVFSMGFLISGARHGPCGPNEQGLLQLGFFALGALAFGVTSIAGAGYILLWFWSKLRGSTKAIAAST